MLLVAISMRHKLIVLTVIMLASAPAFAHIFPLIQVDVQNKSMLDRPMELVKFFTNVSLSNKSALGRFRINNRLKDQQKYKDPFKRRQRPFWNNWNKRYSGKGMSGINYSLGFALSKKIIFRPQDKD
jgi:hypothetical protein